MYVCASVRLYLYVSIGNVVGFNILTTDGILLRGMIWARGMRMAISIVSWSLEHSTDDCKTTNVYIV